MQAEDVEDDDVRAEKSASQRKLIAVVIGTVCLIATASLSTVYFDQITAFFARLGEPPAAQQSAIADAGNAAGPYYYDLPDVLVTLTNAQPAAVLKLRVSLELASEQETSRVEARMPYIMDNFQLYLRELRVPELKGSEGLHHLKKELLARVTAVTGPAKVETLLFRELIIQ
jgi:flagellar FliL protein